MLITLQSIADQVDVNFASDVEVLLIDGASTDGTVFEASKYDDVIPLSCYSESDDGPYDAMNKGLRFARGEWVLFLNAGDRFTETNSLADMLQEIQRSRADVLCFGFRVIGGQTVVTTIPSPDARRLNYDSLGCHQATVFKMDAHRSYAYNLSYAVKADRDVMLRMLLAEHSYGFSKTVVADFRADGVSSTKIPTKEWENVCICVNNHVRNVYTLYAVSRALIRVVVFEVCTLTGLDWGYAKSLFKKSNTNRNFSSKR